MAQERSWRPADYWPPTVYVPPQTRVNWEVEAPDARGNAERARVRSELAFGQQRTSRQAEQGSSTTRQRTPLASS
jgi:hypothetical protein